MYLKGSPHVKFSHGWTRTSFVQWEELYKKAKQCGDISKDKFACNRVVPKFKKVLESHEVLNTYPESWWCNCANKYWKSWPLNSSFSSCYNPSHSPLVLSEYHNLQSSQECPEELLCNEEVHQLLSSLDVTKANGPDGISARTLKHIATSISPLIMKLFNLSLHTGHILSEWKQSFWLCHFPSQTTIRALTIITNQFPFSVCSVRLLERHMHKILTEHLCTYHPLTHRQDSLQEINCCNPIDNYPWMVPVTWGRGDLCSTFWFQKPSIASHTGHWLLNCSRWAPPTTCWSGFPAI